MSGTRGEGKELLRQVALRGTSWLGFDVMTVRPLAVEMAAPRLASRGLRIVDEFEEQELVEQAIDEVLLGAAPGRFRGLMERVGFRDAVRSSISALRLGGVHVGRLAVASIDDHEKQALIMAVLGGYEHLLDDRKAADTADLVEVATEAVREHGGDPIQDRELLLVPGLPSRGLVGRFLRELLRGGATLLKTDAVVGLPVPKGLLWDVAPPETGHSYLFSVARSTASQPPIELFSAASVYDELRGVLRRITRRGIPLDDVEIITPDPAVYGSALHALSGPLSVPVTFAVGLPVERTRPGRILAKYFQWVESGYQEAVFRSLLDAGDLVAPPPHDWMGGPYLARTLRSLRIGWGRDRYLPALRRALENVARMTPGRHESEERFERRKSRHRQSLEALLAIVSPVLKATPEGDEVATGSAASVAAGAESILRFVAEGTDADDTARLRLGRVLARIQTTLKRETDLASARAIVRGYLEIRIPAPRTEGAAPWSAAPGSLYLTDLEHGGASGRGHTFIVGMDANRFPGSALQDPLLLDAERWRLGRGALPLAADRLAERRFLFARLFARLRGEVCLSYSRWDPAEARGQNPAAEVLQALRLRSGDESLSFDDLDASLGQAESRIPAGLADALDRDDVWMAKLALEDGRLLDGERVVRSAFPWLDRGLGAQEARNSDTASAHLGFLSTGLPEWDPRTNAERAVSASGLGDLGACPRRYFLKVLLGLRPPDDPEFDPARWLDPLRRGSLLHTVFERTLRFSKEEGVEVEDDAFMAQALAFLEEEAVHTLIEMPTPSHAVREWEMDVLRADVRSFVAMIRAQRPQWLELELRFGFDEEDGTLDAGGDLIRVRGAIDRVDDQGTHLRVVDYKTGRFGSYDAKSGVYDRGRRLQHVVYSEVAARRFGKPVGSAEYHFPTRRGENRVRAFSAHELRYGGALVGRMLDSLRHGWFPPTDDSNDCRFCDFQENCAVSVDRWRSVDSPLAVWSGRNLGELPELSVLKAVRNWEDEEPVL